MDVWRRPSRLPSSFSAAESELAALFHNGKEGACPLRACLEELGHPQPPNTYIQTDNSTAAGIVNDAAKQKGSKALR